MSRPPSKREDLLQQATALVERVELNCSLFPYPIVVGFRRDHSASFYFGEDFVLHFNAQGELRRAYQGGRLLKAARGRLVSMLRLHEDHQTILSSRELTKEQENQFLQEASALLTVLQQALSTGQAQATRSVPDGPDVVHRVEHWLQQRTKPIVVSNKPNARTE
jgi:hypothetical protein